jgi:hypothetical protein
MKPTVPTALVVFLALMTPARTAHAQFDANFNIPPWVFHCPNAAQEAVNGLRAYVSNSDAETDRLRTQYHNLYSALENIKAMTLVEETKAAGKISVLPAFPTPAPLTDVPTYPRLHNPWDCSRFSPHSYRDVPPWIDRARAARVRKTDVINDLEQLRVTYDTFKAMTQDL